MANDSLYLWNPPEGSETQSISKVQNDKLDEVLSAPVTGEDIAFTISRAMQEKRNPNLTFDEFKMYDEWHKKQEINWWEVASSGFGMFFSEVGAGLASLQPLGEKNSVKQAAINWAPTRLAATATEAFARGTRDMVGLGKIAANNQNSPFYRLFNPNGDVYQRFIDFNDLTEWNITSQKIVDGEENVLLPNTSKMMGKDVKEFSPRELFEANTALAQAGSYFLDPIFLLTLGTSSGAKAGLTVAARGGAKSASRIVATQALKEGITGAESAAKMSASIMDKGRILGAGVTEKIGKSFRVAGEAVDRPINWTLDKAKAVADEFFDANLHTTPNGTLRATAPTKGQAGFGGSLMAGIGLGTLGLPYAAAVVPIWAVAQAARIGGSFFEAFGKELAEGSVDVLGRMSGRAGSTGKLAKTFKNWSPLGDYVSELTKSVAKSGLYGTAIGYGIGGEEGAAQGLGMGAAIGTSHYHWGVASNMIKGQSKERMTVELVNNINSLRERGLTKKADTILKYLDEIRSQHGDDAYYRNLGAYLALEVDGEHVALSVWDKEDYLRLANDPSVDPAVKRDIMAVVTGGGNPELVGQGWNGLFVPRRGGEGRPFFIHKDSQSGRTHVILNAWALDNDGKRQATGLKGEFYHVLADAYKEAVTKEQFKEEVFEGLVRTLSLNHTPEGRAKMAQMLRNAAENLDVFGKDTKKQKASKRAMNMLRVYRKNSPAGWDVDYVMGNEVVTDAGVKRPPLFWQSKNGWRIIESGGRYTLQGKVDGKFKRLEFASLNEAVQAHKAFAPMDLQVSGKPKTKPTPKKTEFEAKAGPRAGEREGFDATVAEVNENARIEGILDRIGKKLNGWSAKDLASQNKSGYDSVSNMLKIALQDGWVFDESRIDAESIGFFHPDYPNAKLDDWYNQNGTRKVSTGTTPPNAAGERTAVTPEAEAPKQTEQPKSRNDYTPEEIENIFRQIDEYEKTGKLSDGNLATLIEEMGEAIWDAHEAEMPFDYLYLAGDLGIARNLIEELKHRFARIVDRNARQAGFVPDFRKDFVEWFKDGDGKAIVDPYMRDLFKKFLAVHKNRKNNLNIYEVDYKAFSPSALKTFIEENGIEHEYDIDQRTGNYVRKSDETINREAHQRFQAAAKDLLQAERQGIDTGFNIYALDKDSPDIGSMDDEANAGTMRQQAWRQYRTTVDDIRQAQRKGTIPTKEELKEAIKNANFGRRGRPRSGEIDDIEASAKKGSIIFSGVPTLEGFKILQKHLPKNEINAIAQIAPLVLDGGIKQPNVLRVKYAGFTHVDEESGTKLKKPKNVWSATEKDMVFHAMELRGTLRNINTGRFDYKRPHAHFLLHGVDINVLQRRIQWMWKNEKETRKRWATMVDFEKDVYRLIENYSMKTAIAGTRFFGGGAEGKSKKRLACAAIGAFPTREMVGGVDADDIEFDMPEIDWHHYQFRAYGQGKAGMDIPWTTLRAEGIKKVYGTNDTMRVPYAERAYYRAQSLFQQASKKAPREGDDAPANLRFVSQELQGGRAKQIFSDVRPSGDWALREKGYTPNDVIRSIVEGQFKLSPEKSKNALDFVKGGIGHDEATNSALVFWHWAGKGVPFETIEQGQIGMHIGTREAALYRAMKVAQETGIDPVSVADNTFPVLVNMKKPLTLMDRGSWSPDDIVDAILYANLDNDTRYKTQQPRVESFYEKQLLDNIARNIGPLTDSDIQFLKTYKLSLTANNISARNAFLAQAEMAMKKGQTPAFEAMSKRMYKAAEPLHRWLETKGIDGIRYRNSVEGNSWSYIAFSGKQVKHLVHNTGEYSPQNMSLMRQQASRIGARSADDAVMLESNYRQAVNEGDVFRAISIKDNFLGDMPANTKVVRQTADEAIMQGMTLEQYNSQFATGTPVVFTALRRTGREPWSSHKTLDMEANGSITARALIKAKNPLVVDANGLDIGSAELDTNSFLKRASENKHDALILTNTDDGVNGRVNQTILIGDSERNNLAVIDTNIARESVPRGLGLVNDVDVPVNFRSQAAKRTFYSAVERFVEEKVTDKTSLNELLGLMDPTKGTGIVKSELEFLDIAGWVEEQKKINGGTKAKVDKQALLKYIAEHKFELQEDKTNTAWYSLQGLDPNNPMVQSQVEGGYEGYAPANKGYDVLHPSTNYRVLLLRAPLGTDYSGGEGGHFKDHENIMAFARVSDVWLDRETEMPSPPTHSIQQTFGFRFIPDETFKRSFSSDFNSARRSIGARVDEIAKEFGKTSSDISSMSPMDLATETMKGGAVYPDQTSMPNHIVLRNLGYIFNEISGANLELASKINEGVANIVYGNFTPNKNHYFTALYESLYRKEKQDLSVGNTTANRGNVNYAELMDELFAYDPVGDTKIPYTASDYDAPRNAVLEFYKLLDSLAPRADITPDSSSKKKMLFVMEIQSDTAQKMQARNDAKTEHILTQAEFEEKVKIEDAIRDVQSQISDAVESVQKTGSRMVDVEKEFPELYKKRQELRDKLSPLLGKEQKTIMTEREFLKIPEVKAEIEAKENLLGAWDKWEASRDDLMDRGDLVDQNHNEAIFNIKEMIGDGDKLNAISDNIPGGKEKFIENLVIFIDRMLNAQNAGSKADAKKMTDRLAEIKESILRRGNVTLEELTAIHTIDQYGMFMPDQSRLPYYDYQYFRGLLSERHTKGYEMDEAIKNIGNSLRKQISNALNNELYDYTITSSGMFKTDDFSKRNLYRIIDEKVDQWVGTMDGHVTGMSDFATKVWQLWADYALKDKKSIAYMQFREAVLRDTVNKIDRYKGAVPSKSETRMALLRKLASSRDTVVTEYMPFLRTEDFTKLMFKKILREAVSNDYEGIIFIPAELPQILTGGDSKYFYGKIVPKVVEGVTKKFGGKLRQNKSIADHRTDPLFDTIGNYLKEEAKDPNWGSIQRAYDGMIQAAKTWISAGDDPKLQQDLRDRITTNKMKFGLTKEQAEQVFDYFVQVVSGMRPESQKTWGMDNGKWTSDGDIDKQASRKGLILDVTPKMDVIKEGQPMWQAASRKPRRSRAQGQAETVGEVRGTDMPAPAPIAKKDRSIGERESGLPIPEIPKDTEKSVTVGGVGREATTIDKRLAVEGVADYRGYKVIYDKANGGYKITDPAGKGVMVPTAYIDRITGEQVVKMNRHVVFPQEAVALIDHLLGGMPKTQDVATPPLPKPAKPQAQVVAPAERAIPKTTEAKPAPASNEMSIVQSQLEATGKSKYYIYNIEFDSKTGEYMARDNAGQPISVTIDNPFQSGPAMVTSIRTKNLESLIAGLDKKFDKTKFARLAPKPQGATAQPAPVAPAPVQPAPVAPVAPVEAPKTPEPIEKPKRRIPASSVPPAVATAPTVKPTPKPQAKPQPKPNVNKPKPKVVMPEEPIVRNDAEVSTSESPQPLEVVSDKEYMEKQAKALGKGFIAMMKDPEMSKYIIDSLNVDDNLTLRGDTESSSTVDGRFSVTRKGKKFVITQNNYDSPITGLRYDKRIIAYVNTIDQAQMLIRRLEVERNMALKAKNMPMENPLMVMAAENPAFEELARQKAIRDNAFIMMLLSMRDQGITPIYIDPNTLQPILVMMPSEEAISQVTRPQPQTRIAGLLPESGGQEKLLPAVLDEAIKFDYVMDAQIKALAQNRKEVAERFINSLGYEILKFKGKFRLFNPLKATISIRDDEDAIMNDLIRDIAKKGVQ